MILALTLALAAPATPAVQSVDPRSYRIMQQFAACVVRGDKEEARAFLATAPESKDAEAAMKRMAKDRSACLRGPAGDGGKLKMKPASLRGALAEQLYLADYATAPAAPAGAPAPFQGSGDEKRASYDVTRCAAMRDPVGADALLRAELNSNAEREALRKVMPAIAGCTPKGAKLGFDRELLRGLMAEGLYLHRTGAGA
jgi:hypothetical protein